MDVEFFTEQEQPEEMSTVINESDTVNCYPGRYKTLREFLTAHTIVDSTNLRILVDSQTLRDAKQDFIVASYLTEHSNTDTIEIKETTDELTPIITTSNESQLLGLGDKTWIISVSDETASNDLSDRFKTIWSDSEPVSFRAPALSKISSSFETRFDSELASDFMTLLEEAYPDVVTMSEMNHVDVALLFAAARELMFYDLNKWGDFIGYASSGTFSRKRQKLEEKGIISTSNVQVDIGRPRMKLHMNEEFKDFALGNELLTEVKERFDANAVSEDGSENESQDGMRSDDGDSDSEVGSNESNEENKEKVDFEQGELSDVSED